VSICPAALGTTNQHEKRAVGQRQAESDGLPIIAGRDRGVRDLGGLDRRSIDRSGFVPALGSCGAGRHFALQFKLRVQVHGAITVKSKTQQIREALSAGDQIGALRIAACFFDRSSATKTYRRASTLGFMTDYAMSLPAKSPFVRPIFRAWLHS
jgi:hypothetical protein